MSGDHVVSFHSEEYEVFLEHNPSRAQADKFSRIAPRVPVSNHLGILCLLLAMFNVIMFFCVEEVSCSNVKFTVYK